MKTKRLILKSILTFLMLIVISCSDNNVTESNENINNTDNKEEVTPSYAPKNILSRKLILYTNAVPKRITREAWAFTSDGKCSIDVYSGFTLTSTPTYTYSRQDDNNSDFSLYVSQKMNLTGSTLKTTYNVTLYFSSSSGGTYSGTDKGVSSSTGTSSRSISGTFSLE